MSIPKNHHYVSQIHQKEFFNLVDQEIYVYDKILDNFYKKKSTKSLFSEEYLNSIQTETGFDNSTLEIELKNLFEDKFPHNINIIRSFLKIQNDIDTVHESLCWLTLLGIIGELRNPIYKRGLDETMLDFKSQIFERMTGIGKERLRDYFKQEIKTPYSNNLSYIDIAITILSKMEPLDFLIYSIESEDSFILPDTSCFQIREDEEDLLLNRIIQIGIPLSDKLFIIATPKTFQTDMHGIVFIKENNSEEVFQINKYLFDFARKAVACKNSEFLVNTINKIKS